MSAFFLYQAECRENYPHLKGPELAKEAGKQWKALSTEERKPWMEKEAEDKVRATRDMQRYEEERKRKEQAPCRDDEESSGDRKDFDINDKNKNKKARKSHTTMNDILAAAVVN